MTATELILICALLAWMGFAFAFVLLFDATLSRTKAWRKRRVRARTMSARRSQLARPRLGSN